MKKIIMKLDDLTCPSCMTKIEAAVGKHAGVSNTKVLFNAAKVKAEYDSNVVSDKELVAVVEKLGYPVTSSKVKDL